MLHVDVDDISALSRLQGFHPEPSVIIFSGGGYQAFWLLADPEYDHAEIESLNACLAERLGGDKCHNIDRIMRLPGTVNVPNAKKRAQGRVPVVAHVINSTAT